MRARLIFALALGLLVAGGADARAEIAHHKSVLCKKKKKKKKTDDAETKENQNAEGDDQNRGATEEKVDEKKTEEKKTEGTTDESKSSAEDEQKRVEEAKKKLSAEGRKESQITPGTASRWSNRGAMTPIVAEVPVTAPLPERAIPVPAGTVETPGQSLTGSEEVLQARLYLFAYHLQTSGQDAVIRDMPSTNGGIAVQIPGESRTFDLYRGRASLAYEHIANSNFGAHLDLEYRTHSSGDAPTDHRINEAYVSYGLVDFRKLTGPDFGIAVGRVAIREAGYAQADGAALRLRIGPDFNLGAFGGFTGNPYGYNWLLAQNQEFSENWIRGGGFMAYRAQRIFANAAAVATYSNVGKGGLDRLYVYGDVAYLATDWLNLFATGWLDVIGGVPIQNVNVVASINPSDEFSLRLSAGRFSTIIYDISTAYTFAIDKYGNRLGPGSSATPIPNPNSVIVDENGQPIVPYDAIRAQTIYDDFQIGVGYKPIRELEIFANGEVLIRDTSMTNTSTTIGAALQFSSYRIQPSVGARYRNPALLDASAQLSYIVDPISNAKAFAQLGVGKGWEGFYAALDGRYIVGDISGLDGGAELLYVLPRDWFPGRLTLRGMIRYYRESLSLDKPVIQPMTGAGTVPNQITTQMIPGMGTTAVTTPIQAQESLLGLLGVEWRF